MTLDHLRRLIDPARCYVSISNKARTALQDMNPHYTTFDGMRAQIVARLPDMTMRDASVRIYNPPIPPKSGLEFGLPILARFNLETVFDWRDGSAPVQFSCMLCKGAHGDSTHTLIITSAQEL